MVAEGRPEICPPRRKERQHGPTVLVSLAKQSAIQQKGGRKPLAKQTLAYIKEL